MNFYRIGEAVKIRPPEMTHQIVFREDSPRLGNQKVKQLKFFGGEFHFFSFLVDAALMGQNPDLS